MQYMQYMDNQLFIVAHEASVKTYQDMEVALQRLSRRSEGLTYLVNWNRLVFEMVQAQCLLLNFNSKDLIPVFTYSIVSA